MKKILLVLFLTLSTSLLLVAQEVVAPIATYTCDAAIITWSALPVGDAKTHEYEATVTIENKTEDTLKSWNIAISQLDTIVNDSSALNKMPFQSLGPWSLFAGTLLGNDQDIAPLQNLSFCYRAQCEGPIVAPSKLILTYSKSYVLMPDQAAASDSLNQ